MAKIIPLTQGTSQPGQYHVRLLAQYMDIKGRRIVRSFYAETSCREEVGDIAFTADHDLADWLERLISIESGPAREIVNRLKGGELIVLDDTFARGELVAAGMNLRPII